MSSKEVVVEKEESSDKGVFGFWVYLMTDCILFASLFATFIVLRNNTFGGPPGRELFDMPYVLAETLILLTSSFTAGLAILAARRAVLRQTLIWLAITALLGLSFLALEINEFVKLYEEDNSWRRSGFLSAFFTLVGTHGLHITAGLIWLSVLAVYLLRHGFSNFFMRRLTMFTLFWHFLDIVWIFIFTIVFLTGEVI